MNAQSSDEVAIHWFRRDLRRADNPALAAAAANGTVIPVFVLDPETEALGSASRAPATSLAGGREYRSWRDVTAMR